MPAETLANLVNQYNMISGSGPVEGTTLCCMINLIISLFPSNADDHVILTVFGTVSRRIAETLAGA